MIGGIVMSQSNLEKQEAKLKALNQKIKDEKNRIKLLAQQFSEFLKEKSVDH